MSISAVASVASFSVVLAETFGAVALSTLIPNAFVESANAMKRLASRAATDPADAGEEEKAMGPLSAIPGIDAVRDAVKNIAAATAEPSDLHLLLPKKATIDAEFEFHGSESLTVGAGLGAQIKLVTVNAGFSALYSSSSSNKVTLHVDFETVSVTIAP
jgi:hypothetical protein